MREALFVVNPSGSGHSGLLWRQCQTASLRHGWHAVFTVAKAGVEPQEIVREVHDYAAQRAERIVFAVGGDGTVRLCAQAVAGSGAPLAVVPRGAANLFAAAVGAPRRLDQALLAGFEGQDYWVDIAEADGEVFVAMAGMGIDAAVVRSTPSWMKHHLGWVGYAAAALPHLLSAPNEMTVHLDGGGPIVRLAQAVVVGNVGVLPGNFELLHGARTDDGVLEVGVLEPRGPFGWLHIARRAVLGSVDGQFEQFQARKVTVHARVPLPRQVDGDVLPPSDRLEVQLRPGALLVRAPSDAPLRPSPAARNATGG